MNENPENTVELIERPQTHVEGLDFYFEDGLMVLTRRYLLNRGTCCGKGCRHCPYDDVLP